MLAQSHGQDKAIADICHSQYVSNTQYYMQQSTTSPKKIRQMIFLLPDTFWFLRLEGRLKKTVQIYYNLIKSGIAS